MKNYRTELSQRVRYAIIAGMAGAFLIPQVGFAAPSDWQSSTAGITQADNGQGGLNTEVTSSAANNVITWRDYSIAKGERVRYDNGNKTNNYLNIVTGANTSNINGTITGGNNVYIVNPNGVIFGKNAEVNVGHLHVSTQDGVSSAAKTAFETGGTSPLDNTAALKADVVNMGKITATSVEVHGSHIRFLNAADVKTSGGTLSSVDMYTAPAASSATDPDGGYAHIGYRTAAAPTNYTVHTVSVNPEYYKLVKDKAELDAINTDTTTLAGNYMLEQDIDLGGATHTPIGGNSAPGAFTGKFDGNFFRVQNFKVSNVNSAGLFGEVTGGRIENLGVAQANIVGKRDNSRQYAGGIVGHTAGTSILKNVYATDSIKVEGRTGRYGGIVGSTGSTSSLGTDHTVIDGAYSRVVIGKDDPGATGKYNGGGIVGHSGNTTVISNSYSAATNTDGTAAYFLYITTPDDKTTIKNSYGVVGTEFSSNDNALSSNGKAVDTYKINGNKAEKIGATGDHTANASSTYTNWDINNTGAPGAKWRIYEGRTLPLLTAFMNGRVDSVGSVGVEYKYRKFNKDGTLVTDFAKASNNHADVPTGTLTYDSKIIKIVDGSDGIVDGSTLNNNVTYDKTLMDDQKNRVTTYTDTNTSALDRDNNIRNAGTKAMLWSDQDGPNLRGVNITIDKRKIDVKDSNLLAKRMYDGTRDVKDAFEKALKNGGLSASGFTDEDLNDPDTNRKIKITPSSDFTATLDNKNVGKNKRVTFTGKIEFSGSNKGNYDLGDFDFTAHPGIQGWAEITKAPLILKVLKDSANKVYDGTNTVTDVTMKANPNVQIDQTLTRVIDGTTVTANIKNGGAGGTADDVSMDTISDPTYVNAGGNAEIHAGTHTIRYTNVKLKGNDAQNYELYYQLPNNTQTPVTGDKLDFKGTIERRRVKVDDFKVYDKGTHALRSAEKTYDGNHEYDGHNVYLSTDTDGDTGIVTRDRTHITFALKDGKGYFIDSDTTKNRTKNVKEATRVAYTVTGEADNHTDTYGKHLLSDYYVLGADGETKNNLEDAFDATGAGKITPKVLTATVQNNHIEKTYDAKQNHTDGNRNDITGEALVKLEGFVGRESRANTSTANYASQNVDWDTATRTEKAQAVTYTASFDRGTGAESDNYTLNTTGTTVLASQTVAGSYTGTIKQRDLGLTFGNVTKIYDGTTTNATKTVTGLNDGLSGAVTGADGTTVASLSGLSNVTSQYADRHAGTNKRVEYNSLSDVLGSNHNYKIADKQYGTGTITRRLIESSGFQVRKKDGTIANATKVYDGTDKFTLEDGTYLVAKTAASATTPNTGVVDVDKDNIYFTMTGNEGHFLKGDTGTDRTSHVSEAERVGYSIAAGTKDGGVSPLSNYYFGNSYAEADRRNLENVKGTDPRDAVTAMGKISAATLTAQTQKITKVYDGWKKHTDGNRKEVTGDSVVSFTGWVEHDGTVERRTNSSTATYADENVARGAGGNIIEKSVTYTAKLTGEYADDYKIVDGTHESTPHGTGANTTVTLTDFKTDVAGGKITPRKLNIAMDKVSKTYDGKAENTDTTQTKVTQFTDNITGSKLTEILGDDNVTQARLTNRYTSMMAGDPTLSSYGRGSTDDTFAKNVNASNGTDHDVQYQKMGKAFRDEFGTNSAGNYAVDETVYGKGTINRRDISPNNFQVRDANGNIANATKVYDGTSSYTLKTGDHLTPNSGPSTGIIATDQNDVFFRLSSQGAQFADSSDNPTANVANATKVLYNVKAEGDIEKIKNYTLNGVNLESGTGKVSGGGSITRRVLELNLVQNAGIDKEYDGQTTLKNTATKNWNALTKTDSAGNVQYATGSKELVNDGTKFNITSNYMNDASTPAPDKNVKRVSGNVADKNIQYNISITGGDANNYSFDGGTSSAAGGLKLSATGKITPKDLSGALKKVTKVYDGTKNVDPAAVGLESGLNGFVSGDTVTLGSHTESFQSENVNGDGTTETIGGTAQKNWVNYSNLTLGGTDAGNYTLASTAKGLGEITPFTINAGNMRFTTSQATKIYDGTKTVKHNESAAAANVKNYIASAEVNLGTNHTPNWVSVRDKITVNSAAYDTTANVNGGASQGVTYKLTYDTSGGNGNYIVATGTDLTATGTGVITPKTVNATINGPLTKTYDAQTTVNGAAKNGAGKVVAGADDLVTLEGLVGSDKNTTTAVYTDKNAGTANRTVNYTITTNTADASNYTIKVNGTAVTTPYATTNNTITKRRVNLTFADVSRQYNGVSENTSITPSLSNAGDAAVLNADHAGLVDGSNKLVGLTGIASDYGTGTTDATFTADPNAGTKSVQYRNIQGAMGTALGTNADNYEFADTGYGKGRIDKAQINGDNVHFTADDARKVYDGTTVVKYNGSSDANEVKKYISNIGVTSVDGHYIPLGNDVEMDIANTHYSSPNATNGTPDTVTYRFRIKSNNFTNNGKDTFDATAHGTIDRRVINLDLKQKTGIDKIYDANANLVDTNTNHYNKFIDDDRLGNVVYAAGTTAENKLVRKADGTPDATIKITTAYADKDVKRVGGVISAQDINYTVMIDAANGGKNYKLSDGTTKVDAEIGLPTLKAQGAITPRTLMLGFKNVEKPYDTTAKNNDMTITSALGGNSDGRSVDTLKKDGILAADGTVNTGAFDMTNVKSFYGTGNSNATFAQNADVVTDANGNVVQNGKDVQYKNLAGTLAGQSYAGNYEIVNTAYGKGTIRKRVVTANDFKFNINNATKTYDGTKDVYWKDTVTGKSYKDLDHVKNYFSTSKLDLGGGNLVDINLNDIQLNSAKYNDERVAHATGVDYDVTINTQNFEFSGTRNRIINHTGDKIEKRDLATKLPPHLIKEYDGEDTFTETNEIFANAMARANLTGVVDRDKNKIQLKVKGTYSSPDASVETRTDAEARTPATAGRDVAYELTLSGDADTLSNYKIGTVETLDSNGEMKGNGSGKADIYKKTLTVSADPIDKVYDGTRTVVRPNGSTTAPHPAANKLKLNGFAKTADHFDFDQPAADKIDGLYSDPNVSRAADGTILDKDIAYSGVKAAFKNYADNHAGSAARNYRVDSDTVSGKGKITPRTITPNDIANGLTLADATKVYDGTTKVKYNGQNTPDALKNYLTSATVNINGTPIDIKKELTIRADEASTHYDTANVAGGAQPRVTYTLNYTGHNFDITGPITKQANGTITKRQVTAYAPGQLTKMYDGTTKVYDSGDPTIKTYYRGNQVTSGADIVQLEEENGDRGLLTNDGVQNISTATFEDKKAGRNKKVNYNIAVDAAHAGNYELVDQRGNVISQTSTNNNTITPRRLDITFGDVSRAYDGTSTNTDVTALVKDSDARATLRRDGVNPRGEQLILRDAANNDITLPSDYGYGRTDSAFTKNADANQTGEPPKDVQYRKLGDAMRTLLGNDADNYDFDETGYGKGTITKAKVRESDFRLKFGDAVKEYDGTDAVNNAQQYLDKEASRMRLPRNEGEKPLTRLQDKDISTVTGTYQPLGSVRSKDASENNRGVRYRVQLSNRNFDFENGWDGAISGDGAGKINRRAITLSELPKLTKVYDGTRTVANAARDPEGNLVTNGDTIVRFRHATDATKSALITGDDVTNASTATYDDANVAWQDNAWKNGDGTVADKDVDYDLRLSGTDAANYKIVDEKGNEIASTTRKTGRITPKEIHLKADPQTRWINEGLPDSYTGTPTGKGYKTGVGDEALPGEIYYNSPDGRLRWGDYQINGYYRASEDPKYQRPDGSRYQLADGTYDGDRVARNYRFVQDPANATALHIGPYVPDTDYYQALTQTSKMLPDEYAYENASLDRRSHFGRDPEAEISYEPPSLNMVKDGVDISKNGIEITDETVFRLVNEVFGA